MSVSVCLDQTPEGTPEYFVQLNIPQNKVQKELELTSLFAFMRTLLTQGKACLGHHNSIDGHSFRVFHSRTHFVGDDGGYSKIGNGDEDLDTELRNGWKIKSYCDVDQSYFEDNEFLVKNQIAVTLKKGGMHMQLMIPNGDRHAPVIDAIYTTLFLAKQFFGEATFAVTSRAERFISSSELIDASESEIVDYTFQEPTYTYLHTLWKSIQKCRPIPATVSLVRKELDQEGIEFTVAEEEHHAIVLSGNVLLGVLEEDYRKTARTLIEIFGFKKTFNFMAYYTPLEESVAFLEESVATIKKQSAAPALAPPEEIKNIDVAVAVDESDEPGSTKISFFSYMNPFSDLSATGKIADCWKTGNKVKAFAIALLAGFTSLFGCGIFTPYLFRKVVESFLGDINHQTLDPSLCSH